jgi:phosphoenolpyruvate phosphomutase
VGAHNGLGARLIERQGFDGVWASGLEISTAHAVPDASLLTMTENLQASQAINDATRLPVICDCDTGYGNVHNVMHMVRKYEAADLAAVVIEDKRFPKVNSFIPGRQELASLEEFCGKIAAAKSAQRDPEFMVIARIEALIAGWGIEEALRRAYAYEEAGADAIVIHSKSKTPDEIFTFAEKWKGRVPLISIPTLYYQVTAQELEKRGFQMVIYANHGLRASVRAMRGVLKSIYETGSSEAVEPEIATLDEVFDLQGMGEMKQDEEKFAKQEALQAIIPAAGDHRSQPELGSLLKDRPLCMLDVAGKTLVERQLELLRSVGVNRFCVVGGYLHEKVRVDGARILFNPEFTQRHSAHSVMLGANEAITKTLIVYSDIIFDRQIVKALLESPHEITLVIDRAYQTLPLREKKLDLAVAGSDPRPLENFRKLDVAPFKPIRRIGKEIDRREANYEFIGMVFLREEGLRELKRAWKEAFQNFQNRAFYESPSPEQASFTDLLQYLIDRSFPVYGMEIEHGWSEIHSLDDYERVNAYFQQSVVIPSPRR